MRKICSACFIITISILLEIVLFDFSISCAAENKSTGLVKKTNIPRFISLKSNETNLRSGPAQHYPIKFVYKQKRYPMEVIAEFEQWRLLNDVDGSHGWVHQSLISGNRFVLIKNNNIGSKKLSYNIPKVEAIILRLPEESSYPIMRAEIGVVAKLKKCINYWCQIELNDKNGWIKKSNLWGVYTDEIIEK